MDSSSTGFRTMFSEHRLKNEVTDHLLFKKISMVAFIGFLPLAATYLFREGLYSLGHPFIDLLAWTMPNLSGSFVFTPAALLIMAAYRKNIALLTDEKLLWAVNALNVALFVSIELVHIVFDLGRWCSYDMLASITGITAATLCVYWYRKMFVRDQAR